MPKESAEILQQLLDELTDIEVEIRGYAALFCNLSDRDKLVGSDFLGPGMAFRRHSQNIQKICTALDKTITGMNAQEK